jgi:CelD/BcsL family acetyltransferase involved in cellulose biosynthesis
MIAQLIDDSERFAAMRAEWSELLHESSAESPFLTWEWLYAWWKHLGARRRLAILAVRDQDRLVGILPLAASRRRAAFWRWEFLATGFAGSDYLDAIVRRGFEPEVLRALGQLIRERNIALHLDHLPPGSHLSRLAPALSELGWSSKAFSHGICPYIPLTGQTWDSFLAAVGPAHRATTRRRLRQLERRFAMGFSRITDAAARRLALNRLFDFHTARFGTRGTAFPTQALRAFHFDATGNLESAGHLRLYGLNLDNELAGVMYGLVFKDRFYFYQHGYDPRFQAHGIGRAVLDLSIKAAIEEGLDQFDLLYGNEAYKFSWTTHTRPLERIELFPAHLGGRIHQRAVETERILRAFLRRVLLTHAPQTS